MVTGKTIISADLETLPEYSHDLQTDSVLINITSNLHCDGSGDRTYITVKTMYGDLIHINQLSGYISINGTRVALKGSRKSSASPEVIFAHSTTAVIK